MRFFAAAPMDPICLASCAWASSSAYSFQREGSAARSASTPVLHSPTGSRLYLRQSRADDSHAPDGREWICADRGASRHRAVRQRGGAGNSSAVVRRLPPGLLAEFIRMAEIKRRSESGQASDGEIHREREVVRRIVDPDRPFSTYLVPFQAYLRGRSSGDEGVRQWACVTYRSFAR